MNVMTEGRPIVEEDFKPDTYVWLSMQRFGPAKPVPAYLFVHEGHRYYKLFDHHSVELDWEKKAKEWRIHDECIPCRPEDAELGDLVNSLRKSSLINNDGYVSGMCRVKTEDLAALLHRVEALISPKGAV